MTPNPKKTKDTTAKGAANPPQSTATKTKTKESPVEAPVDYARALGLKKDIPKVATRGRGPTPHYVGVINAFLESGEDELPIKMDEFLAITGKKVSVASVRQGLRNNLHHTLDSAGNELWDSVAVSIYADKDNPEKSTITLKRRAAKGRKD